MDVEATTGPLSRRTPGATVRKLVLGLAAAAVPGVAGASVISDASFFDPIPNTLIDFQTDGAGNPINLVAGETLLMPGNAYITKGVSFVNGPYWVNDGNAAFQSALTIGGSPKIAIPSSLVDEFEIIFSETTPVKAFGFWVVNNRNVDPAGPAFTAYNAQNQVIGTAQFDGELVDGTITSPNTTADYGFMGILTTENIARVVVTKDAAILDDLRFSPVPTPGVVALLTMSGLVIARRRR